MAELPNSVRSRMRQAEPGPHPDADLLAAFSEQRLRGQERESLLVHLAVCNACREILALAAPPQLVPSAEIAAFRSPRSFRIWQWGAAAASMIVVGAAVWMATPGVVQREASNDTAGPATEQLKDGQRQQFVLMSEGDKKAVPPPSAEIHMPPAARKDQPSPSSRRADEQARVQKPQDSLSFKEGSNASRGYESLGKTRNGASGGVVGGRSEFGYTAPSPTPAAEKKPAPQQKLDDLSSSREPARVQEPAVSGGRPAETVFTAGNAAPSSPPSDKNERSKNQASVETLAASDRDEHEQSVKQFSLARNLAKPKSQLAYRVLPTMRLMGGILQQQERTNGASWQDIKVGGGEPLRTLAIRGDDEVWVGGDKGALYRSANGGKNWTAVDLKLKDKTAAVIALKFRDLQHGELTTSTGEKWVSDDGGTDWKRLAARD